MANARIMLGYISIRSPISGRTGSLATQPGNLVGPSTELMTINQVEPIHVAFSISENQLPLVKKGQTVVGIERGQRCIDRGRKAFLH